MSAYKSPEGTFERILKSVIEDADITADEFRVLVFLASKPDGWQANEGQIAAAINMKPWAIKQALKGLRRQKYLVVAQPRCNGGQWEQGGSQLAKDRVLAGRTRRVENQPAVSPAKTTSLPSSEPLVGKPTDIATTVASEDVKKEEPKYDPWAEDSARASSSSSVASLRSSPTNSAVVTTSAEELPQAEENSSPSGESSDSAGNSLAAGMAYGGDLEEWKRAAAKRREAREAEAERAEPPKSTWREALFA